jgi:pyruvate formate lyase activating enzyme
LQNLATAVASDKPLVIRLPVIPGVNDSAADAAAFATLLLPLGVREVQLLPFHQLGERKYDLLGWDYPLDGVPPLREADLADFRHTCEDHGLRAYF